MTFVLAHLSDPHLGAAAAAAARRARSASARPASSTGGASATAIHRPEVLARIVADLKAQTPDHIAVTGDLVNLALPDEYAPARAWLDALGPPADVTLCRAITTPMCAAASPRPHAHWGDYMRGDDGAQRSRPTFRSCGGAGRWR